MIALRRVSLLLVLGAMALTFLCLPAAANPTSTWGSPQTLEGSSESPYSLALAESPSGFAVALTGVPRNFSVILEAFVHPPGGVWSGPMELTNESITVGGFVVAIDGFDRAIIAYSATDYVVAAIYVANFTEEDGWSPAVALPTMLGNASVQLIAAARSGAVFVAFDDYNDTEDNVYIEGFDPAAGWDVKPAIIAVTNATGQPLISDLRVSATGLAVAGFGHIGPGSRITPFGVFYDPLAGWGTPFQLSATNRSNFPVADFDGDTAWFSFSELDPTLYSCFVRSYTQAGGLSPAFAADALALNVSFCSMAIASNGDYTVLYTARPTATNRDLYAAHYTAAGGWEPAVAMDASAANASAGAIHADGHGNFLVTWCLGVGASNELWAQRYLAAGGWQSPVRVAPTTSKLNLSWAAVAQNGSANVVWTQAGAPYALGTAEFFVDDEAPAITIDTPGPLANSIFVNFSGTTEPGARVWVDGAAAAVDGSGGFTITLPFLVGSWTADVRVADLEGNEFTTNIAFTVDTEAELSVSYPTDGTLFTVNLVPVRGVTEPGAAVTVNGNPASVDGLGIFAAEATLNPGENPLVVQAVDPAGNRATITLHVTYFDAIAPLIAQIANLTAAVDALRNESGGSSAELDAAMQALGAASANLAAANASLAAANANLTAAEDARAAAQLNLTIAQTRLAEAERERDAANARAQAAPAGGNGMLDVLLAIAALAGVGVGLMGLMMGRNARKEQPIAKDEPLPPPKP